jgi:uncharacterized membrane protein
MKKIEFLKGLESRLTGLNEEEKNDILNYYQELIEDKMDDEGLLEEEVISELGSLDEIVKKVNPNYQFNDKLKYNEESTSSNENKAAKIICDIVKIILTVWLVLAGVVVFSIITAIICITVYIIGYGILVLLSNVYAGLVLLGIGICLSGLMFIFVPAVSKAMKFVRNYIDILVKWIYVKLA